MMLTSMVNLRIHDKIFEYANYKNRFFVNESFDAVNKHLKWVKSALFRQLLLFRYGPDVSKALYGFLKANLVD